MLETDSIEYHCNICNKTFFNDNNYNQHCSGKQHEAKLFSNKTRILQDDKLEWPPKIILTDSMHCLHNFYNNTDYKKIIRYVCCVCSRFRMTNDVNLYELEF